MELEPDVIRDQAAFLREALPRKYHDFFDKLCRQALSALAQPDAAGPLPKHLVRRGLTKYGYPLSDNDEGGPDIYLNAPAPPAQMPAGENAELVKRLYELAAIWGPRPAGKATVLKAAASLAQQEGMVRDAKRLDYLETLCGRMHASPRGKVFPLSSDIHLTNFRENSASIYIRDERGRNAQTASGPTLRAAIDKAMLAAAPAAGEDGA